MTEAFHDVLFPLAISFGASGGPERTNEIVRLQSGHEHRNLRETREAVVHIPDRPLLEAMHASADEVAESEVDLLGLPTEPSLRVAPPRLAQAAVALECRLREEHPLGPGSDLVILDVIHAAVRDDLWDDATDSADSSRWEPVARLGSLSGPSYAALGERMVLGRPKLERR